MLDWDMATGREGMRESKWRRIWIEIPMLKRTYVVAATLCLQLSVACVFLTHRVVLGGRVWALLAAPHVGSQNKHSTFVGSSTAVIYCHFLDYF